MALCFGELSAPLASRAVCDDDILDQPCMYNLIVKNKVSSVVKSEGKLLIFSVGDLATVFAKSYLIPDNSEHLFEVFYKRNNIEDDLFLYSGGLKVPTKECKAATAYAVRDVVICEISSKVPEEINADLCLEILDKIHCFEVLVLASCHMASYKTHPMLCSEDGFLKALPTAQFKKAHGVKIPCLEPPNFLSSFPAAVLSECEVKEKPAMCIMNYVNSSVFNILNVENFEKVLEEDFNVKLDKVDNYKHKLSYYAKIADLKVSNLYT